MLGSHPFSTPLWFTIAWYRHASRAENASVLARIDEVKTMVSKNQADHELLREDLHIQALGNQARHSSLNRQLETQATGIMSIMAIVVAVFHELGQAKNLVTTALLSLQMLMFAPLLRGLDPTKGLPVFLEDALGEVLEIPLQWLDDWDVCIARNLDLCLH